jgi:hypothetical protein
VARSQGRLFRHPSADRKSCDHDQAGGNSNAPALGAQKPGLFALPFLTTFSKKQQLGESALRSKQISKGLSTRVSDTSFDTGDLNQVLTKLLFHFRSSWQGLSDRCSSLA